MPKLQGWTWALIIAGIFIIILNVVVWHDPAGYWFGIAAIVVALFAEFIVRKFFLTPPAE